MICDDDARDLTIHSRIESALRFLVNGRKLTRLEALQALRLCALGVANAHITHMIEAITVNLHLSNADLADRIQAFIDLDEEEERERARKVIENTLMEADA